MKKMFCLLFLLFPVYVSAATCSTEDKASLLSESGFVTVNYEEVVNQFTDDDVLYFDEVEGEETEITEVYYTIKVNVLNMSENFYIEATNNVNDETFIIEYSDFTDGTYSFIVEDLSEVVTYKFKVYASSATNCEGEAFDVNYLVVPKYNWYSNLEICEGNEDAEVCQRYTTVSDMTSEYVSSKLEALSADAEADDETDDSSTDDGSYLDVISENYILIISGVIGVVLVITILVVITKKRSDLK